MAILVVGLVALGLPAEPLLLAALVLAGPLMMIFMMSGSPVSSSDGRRSR